MPSPSWPHGMRAHGLHDALDHLAGRPAFAVGQQQRELVAAQPGRKVDVAQARLDHVAELAQHDVAGHVRIGVVDLLEPVDVGHDEAETQLPGARAGAPVFQLLGERAPVREPRQFVLERQPLETRTRLLEVLRTGMQRGRLRAQLHQLRASFVQPCALGRQLAVEPGLHLDKALVMRKRPLVVPSRLVQGRQALMHVGRSPQIAQFLGLQERRSQQRQALGFAPGRDQVIALFHARLHFAQPEAAARGLDRGLLEVGQSAR